MKASNKTQKVLTLVSIVSVIVYALVVEKVYGFHSLFKIWQNIGFDVFFMAIFLIFITHLVRSYRIFVYFKKSSNESNLTFIPLFYLSQTHNLLNNLLPFRSGEVSFPLLMKQQFNTPITHSGAGLLWLRFLDAHTLGMLALFVVGLKYQINLFILLVLCLLAFSLPALVVALKNYLLVRLTQENVTVSQVTEASSSHKISSPKQPWQTKISKIVLKLLDGLPKNALLFFQSWGLTWLNWLIKIFLMGVILMFLISEITNLHANMIDAHLLAGLSGAVAGEITSVLPINAPAGVGTYAAGVFSGIKWVSSQQDVNKDILLAGIQLHFLILLSAIIGVILSACMQFVYNRIHLKPLGKK